MVMNKTDDGKAQLFPLKLFSPGGSRPLLVILAGKGKTARWWATNHKLTIQCIHEVNFSPFHVFVPAFIPPSFISSPSTSNLFNFYLHS
jgi:hypothetical protein